MAEIWHNMQWAGTIIMIAAYFIYLGMLNTRSRPWLVNARLDFSVLVMSFTPLLIIPLRYIMSHLGLAGWLLPVAVAGVIVLSGRSLGGWVIYNVTRHQAQSLLRRSLESLGVQFSEKSGGLGPEVLFEVPAAGLEIRLSGFTPLRNVTIHLRVNPQKATEQTRALARELEKALRRQLAPMEASPQLSGASFLAVGSVMILLPVIILANQMPTMVQLVRQWIFG